MNIEHFSKYANEIGISSRDQTICFKNFSGGTFTLLSQEFGISRSRINQIIRKCDNDIEEYRKYRELANMGLSSDYVNLLSDYERKIFDSFFLDQQSYVNVSDTFDISPTRVKQIIRRCILKLDGEFDDRATLNRQVGEKLRTIRKNRHLTLEQFALQMNISLRTARRHESGESKLPTSLAKKIADFYGVTLISLIGKEEQF